MLMGILTSKDSFGFRGFQGEYEVEVVQHSKKVLKKFVVDKGNMPLVVTMDL